MSPPQPNKRQRVETIGDRLAHARRVLGVTIKQDISTAELARMADLPTSTVTRIESGESEDPNEATLQKLAGVLRVSSVWLRYGVEPGGAVPISEPGEGKGA